MPVEVAVQAMSKAEAQEYAAGRYGDANWRQVDPDDLASLPTSPGVYLGGRVVDQGELAVLYVGRGTGQQGVGGRLRDEFGWIAQVRAEADGVTRSLWWSAHPRTMVGEGSQVWWLATSSTNEAIQLEADLLELSVVVAGAPPLLNGKAWWSDGAAANRVRGWFASQAGRARLPAS